MSPTPDAASTPDDQWWAAPWLPWPQAIEHQAAKWEAATRLAGEIKDGDVIGIGSGSSAYLALWAIADRVQREGLRVRVTTSSQETEIAATKLGLALTRLDEAKLSWIVDGADEVDPGGRFLKGRGGALFREKLLWAHCQRRYVVIDSSKRVATLGSRFPVPIEVHPAAVQSLVTALEREPCTAAQLRVGGGKDGPVITESGFFILDARFAEIPAGLHDRIKAQPGVLETGIFEGYPAQVIEADG